MPCALPIRSEEHTSEPQSPCNLVCRLLLEKKTEAEALIQAQAARGRLQDEWARARGGGGVAGDGFGEGAAAVAGGRRDVVDFFFLMIRGPPRSTLFPSAMLFR